MMSSGIPSRPPGKLFTVFQLEFWEIQLVEMEKVMDQKKCDDGNTANSNECSSQRRYCNSSISNNTTLQTFKVVR